MSDVEAREAEPFVEYGDTVETEDALVANRAGLLALRAAIDTALAGGEPDVASFADFTRITVVPRRPGEKSGEPPSMLGCAAALMLVVGALEGLHGLLHVVFDRVVGMIFG